MKINFTQAERYLRLYEVRLGNISVMGASLAGQIVDLLQFTDFPKRGFEELPIGVRLEFDRLMRASGELLGDSFSADEMKTLLGAGDE